MKSGNRRSNFSQDSNTVTLQGTVTGPFGVKIPIPGLVTDFCEVIQCPIQKVSHH